MGNSVRVGREAVHGEAASALVAVPCNFIPREMQGNQIPDEVRNGQDEHYSMLRGVNHLEFEVRDSFIYHDSIGLWLASALGAPTSDAVAGTEDAVHDSVYEFEDDPESLTLEYTDPRRPIDPCRATYGVADRLVIKFDADGTLTYSVNGVAQSPEELEADPEFEFSQALPFTAWAGEVTLGGDPFGDLVSAQLTIVRNRRPFWTVRNTQSPTRMSRGKRRVEFEMTVDFDDKAEISDFRQGLLVDGLGIVFTDTVTVLHGADVRPQFEIDLSKLAYETAEKDWDVDEPQLKLTGKALYDVTEGRVIQARVRSDVDYAA